MDLKTIKDFLIYNFTSESELLNTIEKLNKNFTINREKISEYLNDPKMVAAYTAFYFTTNYPKLDAVLSKIEDFENYLLDKDIIDIGCGPGTFLLGLKEKFKDSEKQFIGIETSALMRKQAMKLASGLNLSGVKVVESTRSIKTKGPALIFGHSANEMGSEKVMSYIKSLNPEVILFIEPGTKQAFAPLMEIREKLIHNGYFIHYPCPGQGNCPMEKDDWCHQYIYVQQSEDVSRLAQMAKKNRNLLPLTIHAYVKDKNKPNKIRLVRYLQETKHSFDWQICESDNVIKRLEITKKGMSKSDIKKFRAVYAGDSLDYSVVKELKNGILRVSTKSIEKN